MLYTICVLFTGSLNGLEMYSLAHLNNLDLGKLKITTSKFSDYMGTLF